jgi:hypothetical protein
MLFAMSQQPTRSERQEYGEDFHQHSSSEKQRWREVVQRRFPGVIVGVLSCYDRLLLQGTIPGICFAGGMEKFLRTRGIQLKDYAQWASPLAESIKSNAEALARKAGIEIQYLRKKVRKEDLVQQILSRRGEQPGLVCIFSVLERCDTYRVCGRDGRCALRPDAGKCLHYYFYFLDAQWGLGFIRLPTWAPFRMQVYVNGHNWLARQLNRENLRYRLLDNAFVEVEHWERAQQISDRFRVQDLHHQLNCWAQLCCPVLSQLGWNYHWSVDQAEYATDDLFVDQKKLAAVYDPLIRLAIHTVRADHVATFLGKKLNANFQGEAGNRFDIRIQGTRIKHTLGPVSIKIYDKFSLILRIETTVNDLTFFQHYREVEQRDGQRIRKWAQLKKNIYSLPILQERLLAANWRYIQFLCALADPSAGTDALNRISRSVEQHNRTYRGFNFFSADDQSLLLTLLRGEYTIRGFANKDLRRHLPRYSPGQISRFLKRLRLHGIAHKIQRSYRYRLSTFGLTAITLAAKLKHLVVLPELAVFAHC